MRPLGPTSTAVVRFDQSFVEIHNIWTYRQAATNTSIADDLVSRLALQCPLRTIDASQPQPIQQQDIREVRKVPDFGQAQVQIHIFASETFVAIPTNRPECLGTKFKPLDHED
jgi:hypothetical protein